MSVSNPGLVVTNQGADRAAVGVADFPDLVPQAHGMPYRVGPWARAFARTPAPTLAVAGLAAGGQVVLDDVAVARG